MQDFVVFDHVCKTYQMGDVRIDALKDASFTIAEGEICVIVGQSGAGKTTLLNILGGMDRLTSGHVLLAGGKFCIRSPRPTCRKTSSAGTGFLQSWPAICTFSSAVILGSRL